MAIPTTPGPHPMRRRSTTPILPFVSPPAARAWLVSALWLVSGLCLLPRPGIGAESAIPERFEDAFKDDNPLTDGWTTEVLQSQVGEQWKRLSPLLTSTEPPSLRQLEELITDGFHCEALRPEKLKAAFREPSITILRPPSAESDAEGPFRTDVSRGAEGFAAEISRLQRVVSSGVRIEFKVFRIEVEDDDSIVTRQFVTLSGRGHDGYREIHAVWHARWSRRSAEDPAPRLMSIRVMDYEEAVSPSGPLFADCTEAVLGHNPCYEQQLLYSMDYWSNRMLQVDAAGIQGCAVGDVNGDGLEDLYLCQSSWLPNRLFIHAPDGRAVDRSA